MASIVDRANELLHHSDIMLALITNKIVALPLQTTLAPILSLPLILANLARTDEVHIIPTPFTEAIVFEITEIIKYLRPDYRPE
jgi:hypothetical protein